MLVEIVSDPISSISIYTQASTPMQFQVLTSIALHWPHVSRNAPSHTLSCRDGEEGGRDSGSQKTMGGNINFGWLQNRQNMKGTDQGW